jgi:hypothetical protein
MRQPRPFCFLRCGKTTVHFCTLRTDYPVTVFTARKQNFQNQVFKEKNNLTLVPTTRVCYEMYIRVVCKFNPFFMVQI